MPHVLVFYLFTFLFIELLELLAFYINSAYVSSIALYSSVTFLTSYAHFFITCKNYRLHVLLCSLNVKKKDNGHKHC